MSLSIVGAHRRGVPSATSSKGWWKTSTTVLCSVWTVRGITQRRIPYSVRLHHFRWDFKESNYRKSSAPHVSRFQPPGFNSWLLRSPETERATTTPCSDPSKEPLPLRGFYEHRPLPTHFVSTVKFYCANYNSCLFSNNVNAAFACNGGNNKIRTFYWSVESDSIKENLWISEPFTSIFNFLLYVLMSIYSVLVHLKQ